MLAAGERDEHALLVAATGAGKTLAGFLPTLVDLAAHPSDRLHTLYVSPIKALAADVERNLLGPIDDMGLDISVESRSGDTSSDKKARQRRSEEHTSELQSLMRISYAVFCLKKKKRLTKQINHDMH